MKHWHFSLCEIPPRFDRVQLTVVNSASKTSVLQQELSSLLLKGVIEEVPRSDIEQGFFSHYFLVQKKDGGLRPILDLRRLNLSLYKGKFKMLTLKAIMSQVQGGDWFVTIDLKDAYFHIQVIRRHRKFLRFAFGGKAYQYKVLPFGLALAPRTFTKCMYAALAPLRFQGIRVLNYLDDWLILAHSRELVSRHRDIVLQEISFSHLNRQGGSRSRTLDRLSHRLLLWSQDKFLSLRAVHVPGILNLAADFLSRQELRPGEWVLNRHTVAQIWDLFGEAEVDLFASQESSRCPLWFSLSSPATLGRSCVRPSGAEHETVRVSTSQADSGIPMQGEGERCPSPTHSPILALPDLVLRANSSVSAPLGDSDQAGPAFSASGQDLATKIMCIYSNNKCMCFFFFFFGTDSRTVNVRAYRYSGFS